VSGAVHARRCRALRPLLRRALRHPLAAACEELGFHPSAGSMGILSSGPSHISEHWHRHPSVELMHRRLQDALDAARSTVDPYLDDR
jgi:hypothetical protein